MAALDKIQFIDTIILYIETKFNFPRKYDLEAVHFAVFLALLNKQIQYVE